MITKKLGKYGVCKGVLHLEITVDNTFDVNRETMFNLIEHINTLYRQGIAKNVFKVRIVERVQREDIIRDIISLLKAKGWTVVLEVVGKLYYEWYQRASVVEAIIEKDWLQFPVASVVWDATKFATVEEMLQNEPDLGLWHEQIQKHVVCNDVDAFIQLHDWSKYLWTLDM